MVQNVVGRWEWEEDGRCLRSLVNAKDLQIEYARVLHETLLVPAV